MGKKGCGDRGGGGWVEVIVAQSIQNDELCLNPKELYYREAVLWLEWL